MGFPKMLLSFNGKTMIENVISNVTGSDADNTLVVLGPPLGRLTDIILRSKVNYCFNINYQDGMLSSVRCGFKNIPLGFKAALVLPGDQPLITSGVINTVIDAYRASGKGIVIPVHNKKRGHPLLLDSKYIDEINRLEDREGLRSLAYLFPDDVLEVETRDSSILRDFDTYEDYRNEVNQIQ